MDRIFRFLREDEIECRIGTINEKGLSLLLYKDARCDMNILDETFGAFGWQRHHSRDNANCVVAVWDEKKQQWIEKEDTGTESNTEAEKGLASDSFKRSCFNWGIGRELYTAPFIWIPNEKCNMDGKRCNDKFRVTDLEYDKDGKISKLKIYNENTERVVFAFPSTIPTPPAPKPEKAPEKRQEQPKNSFKPTCTDCNKEITPAVHDWSVKEFKVPLCMECQDKRRKAQKK